jgi:acyl carrier protein
MGDRCTEMASVQDRIIEIVAEHLDISPASIRPSSCMSNLGADSMDMVQLSLAMEIEFNVALTDDEMELIVTIGDAVKVFEAKTGMTNISL